ncbi:hypothetical protein [Halogeometricum sp. CBA1124]|uniref:DUF7847 domain-containing protein n=1 Tax=Halogeometricum sp. CBA1124 TaxID=2668071 RepID=UPI00142C5CD2|nr:hypothetical protein [Halogeometricum sp. CBA1124]MUV58169.1 hypothetical protein [Halogeometricum sp. CBA1124]
MSALQSLRTAVGSLGRNPVLFLVGLAYGLVTLPQSALQLAGVPLAPTVLQAVTFFVTPFLIAGIIGMASESLDGETSLETLTRVGRDRYVPLLVAKFVELALLVGLGIAAGIVGVVGGLVAFVALGSPVVAAIVGGVVLLAFVVVFFFIQFFPVAVSLGDADAIDSFRVSIRLVRQNLLSTLGYSIIGFVVSTVATLPVSGPIYFRVFQNLDQLQDLPAQGQGMAPGATPQAFQSFQFSTQEVLLLSAISLAVTMLLFAFRQTYATAFYRDHAPSPADETADFDDDAFDDDAFDDDAADFGDDGTTGDETTGFGDGPTDRDGGASGDDRF